MKLSYRKCARKPTALAVGGCHGAVVFGNVAVWCVSILLVVVLLQGSFYFALVVAPLYIGGLISIVLVSRFGKSEKSKEWYGGC